MKWLTFNMPYNIHPFCLENYVWPISPYLQINTFILKALVLFSMDWPITQSHCFIWPCSSNPPIWAIHFSGRALGGDTCLRQTSPDESVRERLVRTREHHDWLFWECSVCECSQGKHTFSIIRFEHLYLFLSTMCQNHSFKVCQIVTLYS